MRGALKLLAEQVLWARVELQRRGPVPARLPPLVAPTSILRTGEEWREACRAARRLRLPLHPTPEKTWDTLGAVAAILESTRPTGTVVDAGSARYSCVLPWLRLYGYSRLLGINLEFGREVSHGPVRFRHGDATATGLDDASIDAVTCLSVIEHGVPIPDFMREVSRILRPGGLLCVSTDYNVKPPDTAGRIAYGQPVKIFGPDDIRELVALAQGQGLRLVGPLKLDHEERPVHWRRMDLRYTFILLTFRRDPYPGG